MTDPNESSTPSTSHLPTVRCPHCGGTVLDETLKCPRCGEWIIDRPANEAGRSPWFWPIVIAIGAAMILVILVVRTTFR